MPRDPTDAAGMNARAGMVTALARPPDGASAPGAAAPASVAVRREAALLLAHLAVLLVRGAAIALLAAPAAIALALLLR
jgi:hypothetical protein